MDILCSDTPLLNVALDTFFLIPEDIQNTGVTCNISLHVTSVPNLIPFLNNADTKNFKKANFCSLPPQASMTFHA